MKRTVILFCFLLSSAVMAEAQSVREVTVSADVPYSEPVEAACDETGLVLNVRMAYDEDSDILSLSLVPDRPVIFFREDVMYKDVFSSKSLKTEKLPYEVQVSPASGFKLSNTVYKQYSPRRKNHIYHRWLKNLSSGAVELCPEITEAGNSVPLVTTDSLYRRFKVSSTVSRVSFKLRNVLTADMVKRKKNGKSVYSISGESDLNTTFNVTLRRSPCYGMEPLLVSVGHQLSQITAAYHRLLEACPDGIVKSEEECGVFNEHRKYLETQFPLLDMDSGCPDVKAACAEYNSYVDSIRNAPCQYVPADLSGDIDRIQDMVQSGSLVSAARKINEMAIQIIMSNDVMEKRDICYEGNKILESLAGSMNANGVVGEDKVQAIQLFNEARNFWLRVINRHLD